jgi:hypothetical protein
MGRRSVKGASGFDGFWPNARTVPLHDLVDWKHPEIGPYVLTGWELPWGIYQ